MALFADDSGLKGFSLRRAGWIRRDEYSLLLSALPRLPYRLTSEPVPISRTRLWARLDLLHTEHRQILKRIIHVLSWEIKPLAPKHKDKVLQADTQRLLADLDYTALGSLLRQRLDLRSVVAALQYRLQHPDQAPQGDWTPSSLRSMIQRKWHQADFGLSGQFPYVLPVAQRMQQHETLQVEKTVFEWLLRQLRCHAQRDTYSFVAVVMYWMQWDLLDRWGRYHEQAAAQRLGKQLEQCLASPAFTDLLSL
ncbi:MAG: hypothetical protein P8104_00485 [Gammaproteobacteria bacterium]